MCTKSSKTRTVWHQKSEQNFQSLSLEYMYLGIIQAEKWGGGLLLERIRYVWGSLIAEVPFVSRICYSSRRLGLFMTGKWKHSTDLSIIWVTVLPINRPEMSEVSAEPSAAYLPILCTIWQHQSPLCIKSDQWDCTLLPSYSNHGLNFPLQTSCITWRPHDPICSKNKCLVSALPSRNNLLIVTIYSQ